MSPHRTSYIFKQPGENNLIHSLPSWIKWLTFIQCRGSLRGRRSSPSGFISLPSGIPPLSSERKGFSLLSRKEKIYIMKAAVVVANEDVQYQEVEEPKVTKGTVKNQSQILWYLWFWHSSCSQSRSSFLSNCSGTWIFRWCGRSWRRRNQS
mgnify:CR=1 FL=1